MPADLCRRLEWDSGLFGLRIARFAPALFTADLAPAFHAWCAAERIDCVYYLAGSDDPRSSAAAQDAGFRFVDIRVTLERPVGGGEPAVCPDVRRFRAADLAALRRIARESHYDSRFYADPRFPRDRCDRLYETWIEKSCGGWADAVWVAEADGVPAGYLTCHLDSPGSGSIGLVAVDRSCRGRGLGAQLLHTAVAHFQAAGVDRIQVVTQGRNVSSQRLYQRAGFLISGVQLWHHCWFPGT